MRPPADGGRRARGDWAERLACEYLQRQGLHLLTRNYRCRRGELDLVMRDAESLVFVEVRFRSHADFGGALESVGATKMRRLVAAAEHYLSVQRVDDGIACRFDVVCVGRGAGQATVEWIRDAFQS